MSTTETQAPEQTRLEASITNRRRIDWLMAQQPVLVALSKILGTSAKTVAEVFEQIDAAIVEAAKPPPVTRVFTKKPGDRLHVYEIEGDILTAIKAARDEGYPRAMTLVPKATFQLGVKS